MRVAQPGVGVGAALSHAALSTPATGGGQALPAETERQLLGCAWKPTTGWNSSYLQQGPFSSEISVSHTVRQSDRLCTVPLEVAVNREMN